MTGFLIELSRGKFKRRRCRTCFDAYQRRYAARRGTR